MLIRTADFSPRGFGTGFLKFLPLGGWFDQILLGQRVIIKTRKGDVVGVIGAKPPHMLSPEERSKVVTKQKMYIDVGATSKEQVEEIEYVKIRKSTFRIALILNVAVILLLFGGLFSKRTRKNRMR